MSESGTSDSYRVGDLLLDVAGRLLTRNGAVVPLPPKTFELLVELVRRAPGVVRRQELIDTVWPNEYVNDEALTQRVMLLRRTLGDDPRKPTYIASVPRWGYRLVAPVETLAAASSAPPAGAEERFGGDTVSGLERAISSIRRRDRWLATGALAAAAIGVAVILVRRAESPPIASLAIAPFAASSSGGDAEILCDGIPATLTATMTQVPGLRVMAASTMARYRGRSVDPQEVGRELGVRAVLTGKLARRDGLVVIDTELVDVKDGSRLWGARLERRPADLLAVQDEIASEIARGMRLRLTGEQRSRLARRARETESVEAYTFYLKGRNFWNKRDEKGFGDAIACFRAAIDLDPSYALPYVGLADCFALEGSMEYGIAPPRDIMPKARGAAARALELDPELAEGHASLGLVLWLYDWERARAEHELRRAIELSPGYATAHQWLAELLAEQGRAAEATEEIRRAQQLNPLSLVIAADQGLLPYYRRDFDAAIEQYRATLAMDPSFLQARLGLGLAYVQKGEDAEAVRLLEETDRLAGGAPPVLSALGYAYGMSGREAEARRVRDELLELAKRRYVSAFYVAGVYLGLGDRDGAFTWLGRACEERAGLLGALGVWPAFDPLRDDPRFAALMRCAALR